MANVKLRNNSVTGMAAIASPLRSLRLVFSSSARRRRVPRNQMESLLPELSRQQIILPAVIVQFRHVRCYGERRDQRLDLPDARFEG